MDGQSLKLISSTSNSQVYLYTTKAGKFALKYVPSSNKQQILHLSNEAKVLSALDHDFIVKSFKYQQKLNLHGKKQNSQFRDFGDVLVMEYAPKGSLLNFIQQNKLSLHQIKTVFKNICQAVKHVHVKGYSHRDLKLENILVFQQNNKIIPKLADFGFASYCYKEGEYLRFKNYRGTPKSYMAPEIDEVRRNKQHSYDAMKSDIFSLGVIMFALVLGRLPFEYATKEDKIYNTIVQQNYEEFWKRHESRLQKLGQQYSEQDIQKFKDLFVRMVSFDPQNRPSISEILDNSWLSI